MVPVIIIVVFGGANFYVAIRLHQWLSLLFTNVHTAIYICAYTLITLTMFLGFLLPSSVPLPIALRKAIDWIGACWMGVYLTLLALNVIADAALLIGSLVKLIPRPMPQSVRFYAGLAVTMLTICLALHGVYNARQIRTTVYEVTLSGKELPAEMPEMKIALISDLHLGAIGFVENSLEHIVAQINAIEPDIVCIVGDIFNGDYYAIDDPEAAIAALGGIEAKHGVYACFGNHDGGRTIDKFAAFLEECGIRLLQEEFEVLQPGVAIAGRLDRSPIGGAGERRRKPTEDFLGEVDQSLPIIVLDHDPAHAVEYGSAADLILAGHTHKGQLFPNNILTKFMYKVVYGYYKEAGGPHVVITSGAGTWGPPMRVGSFNEIVSITLR